MMDARIRLYVITSLATLVASGAPPLASPTASQQEPERPVAPGSAWLGVGYDPDDRGDVVVRDVAHGSPAFHAGLSAGDVIVRVGDEPASVAVLVDAVAGLEPGDTIRLGIRDEDGRERDVELAAARRPAALVSTRPGGRIRVVRMDTMRSALRALLDSARIMIERTRVPPLVFHRTDSTITYEFGGEPIVIRKDSLRRHGSVVRVYGDSLMAAMRSRQAASLDSLRQRVDSVRDRDEAARLTLERMLRARRDERGAGAPLILHRAAGLGDRAIGGAEMAALNPGLGRYFERDHGLLVLRVLPGTPAERAGLEPGDVVVEAGGHSTRSIADLRYAMTAATGEDTIPLEVVRDGAGMTLRIEREE
ncbi:MAG: PDZ domain-containing protein [Gemmatimonadota bacterium]